VLILRVLTFDDGVSSVMLVVGHNDTFNSEAELRLPYEYVVSTGSAPHVVLTRSTWYGMNESDVQLTLGHGSYLIGDARFGTLLTIMIKLPDPANQVAIVGKP